MQKFWDVCLEHSSQWLQSVLSESYFTKDNYHHFYLRVKKALVIGNIMTGNRQTEDF